jgi:IS5 family transposase
MGMVKQQSFSDIEYAGKKRKTRKEIFLARMEKLVPWRDLASMIEPIYPKSGAKGGRPTRGIEVMLRMFFVSCWYNLSDEGAEDAVTENQTIRNFVGINLLVENAPDATTLLRFRHLLEENHIAEQVFSFVNEILETNGLAVSNGTIEDATIIEAPSSTKNKDKARDPEMRQTKKGNQWYFGMKTHIGVDSKTGITHTVTSTAANQHDITEAHNLIRDTDEVIHGDSGYLGIEKRPEIAALERPDMKFEINMRRGKVRHLPENDPIRIKERAKSSIRAKVERPFLFVKNQFGYRKTRYRGLAKNHARLLILFASANLIIASEQGDYCQTA